jgi:hypothetical protein
LVIIVLRTSLIRDCGTLGGKNQP